MQIHTHGPGIWLASALLSLATACGTDEDAPSQPTTDDAADVAVSPISDANATVPDASPGEDTGLDAADHGLVDATAAADDVPTPEIQGDGGPPDAPMDDVPAPKVCSLGQTKCIGLKLGTCGPYQDGWIVSSCFPGQTCVDKGGKGQCVVLAHNLVIAFDTSGSMLNKVKGCGKGSDSWPTCKPSMGCSLINASKLHLAEALAKIDEKHTHMALFRFPQTVDYTVAAPNCQTGFYKGQPTLTGESNPGPSDQETVEPAPASPWFWQSLDQTLCVPFPANEQAKSKPAMLQWMNGTESKTDPELRPTGGTPIGKTLFYIGEYLRNRVVVQGRPCKTSADCQNLHYACKQGDKPCESAADGCSTGTCVDPARACRETTVVLFTDGGEANTDTFFSPWTQAKRLGFGLGCKVDSDCVGGAVCKPLKGNTQPKLHHCRRPTTVTDWYCNPTMAPCLPTAKAGTSLHCAKECVRDPLSYLSTGAVGGVCTSAMDCGLGETCAYVPGAGLPDKHCIGFPAPLSAVAKEHVHNALRSPDGKPFGVRLVVVDISGSKSLTGSMSLALAGNGQLLGIDAADPINFLAALKKAFDFKKDKPCQ